MFSKLHSFDDPPELPALVEAVLFTKKKIRCLKLEGADELSRSPLGSPLLVTLTCRIRPESFDSATKTRSTSRVSVNWAKKSHAAVTSMRVYRNVLQVRSVSCVHLNHPPVIMGSRSVSLMLAEREQALVAPPSAHEKALPVSQRRFKFRF